MLSSALLLLAPLALIIQTASFSDWVLGST